MRFVLHLLTDTISCLNVSSSAPLAENVSLYLFALEFGASYGDSVSLSSARYSNAGLGSSLVLL